MKGNLKRSSVFLDRHEGKPDSDCSADVVVLGAEPVHPFLPSELAVRAQDVESVPDWVDDASAVRERHALACVLHQARRL